MTRSFVFLRDRESKIVVASNYASQVTVPDDEDDEETLRSSPLVKSIKNAIHTSVIWQCSWPLAHAGAFATQRPTHITSSSGEDNLSGSLLPLSGSIGTTTTPPVMEPTGNF